MARTASSVDRTAQIVDKLKASNCKTYMFMEVDINGTWYEVKDLDVKRGINISKSSKTYKYANFSQLPATSSISFEIINKDGEYTPGSGQDAAGIFDLDTKIRVNGGYLLDTTDGVESEKSVDLNPASYSETELLYTFYSQKSGGNIVIDASNTDGNTDIYFSDFFQPYYDSETYDDSTYSHDAYVIFRYNLIHKNFYDVTKLKVTANSSNGNVYYFMSDTIPTSTTLSDWTSLGATINGEQTYNIDYNGEKYVYIAIVWNGTTWCNADNISSVKIVTESYFENIYKDVFYLDTPAYTEPRSPGIPSVLCKGRDNFKRAIEVEIDTQDLSGGVSIQQLIKDICDRIGIPYTSTSISDLTGFGNRVFSGGYTSVTGNSTPIKANTIFENCMQIINKYDTANSTDFRYQMYLEYDDTEEDNVLFIQPWPNTYQADYVFNYRHYSSLSNRRQNYDKLLKRLTVISKSQACAAESQLGTRNITSSGTAIQVPAAAGGNNFVYKRFTVTDNGSSSDLSISINSVEPQYITFDVSGTTIDIDITIFGNDWNTDPDYEGEWINYSNMVNNKGVTSRIINPLLISDDEARDIGHGFNEKYGSPTLEAMGIEYPYLNLLLEQNDTCLLWSRFLYLDDLFFITGMKYQWNIQQDSSSFNLMDSGLNFEDEGAFIYDRDEPPVNTTAIIYDAGFLYDMQYGVDGKPSDVDTSIYIQNIDCTQYLPIADYSTGTNAFLSYPDDNENATNDLPSGAIVSNGTITLYLGDYTWENLDTGLDTGTTYGACRLQTSGGNWAAFDGDGLYRITFEAGGYLEFYIKQSEFVTAFQGNSDDIYIAQNGSIYKGNNVGTDASLVIRWDGVAGAAGGGSAIDTIRTL